MSRARQIIITTAAVVAAGLVAALLIYRASRPVVVTYATGAILRADPDPRKQRPVENAIVRVNSTLGSASATSNGSGLFLVRLRPPAILGQQIRITVRHPGYSPFEESLPAREKIWVLRLTPLDPEQPAPKTQPRSSIANLRVRYAFKSTTTADVGSVVRTFDIPNTGNVPCDRRSPCSPNGKWKAAVVMLPLNAGPGRQFRNVRVSCTSGPCPFSRLESDDFTRGGRTIHIVVRNWSDTVTYLVEAEVSQTVNSEAVRRSYPAIFGRSMNFTLPATAQGPSIEAEVDGSEIVFPLGPSLKLSWADCRMEIAEDRTKLYRCELKPDYRFK